MVMISDNNHVSGGAIVFVKTFGAPVISLLSNLWLFLPTCDGETGGTGKRVVATYNVDFGRPILNLTVRDNH